MNHAAAATDAPAPAKAKTPRRWVVRVQIRARTRWLPSVAVTVEGSTWQAAAGRGMREAKRKAARPHAPVRVYEALVSVQPIEPGPSESGS